MKFRWNTQMNTILMFTWYITGFRDIPVTRNVHTDSLRPHEEVWHQTEFLKPG